MAKEGQSLMLLGRESAQQLVLSLRDASGPRAPQKGAAQSHWDTGEGSSRRPCSRSRTKKHLLKWHHPLEAPQTISGGADLASSAPPAWLQPLSLATSTSPGSI